MRNTIFFIAFAFLLLSCRRESTTWNTDVAVPLFRGEMGLSQIIPDSLLSADDEGLWHLIYSENITDLNIDSLVNVTDTTISQTFKVPFSSGTITLPAGASIIDVQQEIELNGGGAQLRLLRMKGGVMNYTVKSYINGYMTSVFTMPGVSIGGIPISITANTTPSVGTTPSEAVGIIDLTGYEIDLTGLSGSSTNTIASSIAVNVSANAPTSAAVEGQDSVVVELSFENAIIDYALGYFGQHNYSLDEDITFLEGNTMPEGLLMLERASMNMRLENFIGVDARVRFTEISAINAQNASVELSYAPFTQSINITRALDMGETIWPTLSQFQINETNSNITSWMGNLPSTLKIRGNVEINPLGNIAGSSDFIYTDSPLSATLDVDVPLRVNFGPLILRDTIAITEEIDEDFFGNLVIYLENGFPMNGDLSIKLRNLEDGSEIILSNEEFIASGIVGDTDGEITPVTSIIRIMVNQEVFQRLRNDNAVVLEAIMGTPIGEEYVGIYSHYKMSYRALLEGTYGVKVN